MSRFRSLPVLVLLLFVPIWLAAGCSASQCEGSECACDGESVAELCAPIECGQATVVDRCDLTREVYCGSCECVGEECECVGEECACEGESVAELCAREELECGQATVSDACQAMREIDCGACTCEGESVAELCGVEELDCGQATVTDSCGTLREIDCGECGCVAETVGELCERDALECGQVTVVDGCGATRSLHCGGCPGSDECVENACQCAPESAQVLCADLGASCGALSAEDRCGNSRDLDCGDCDSIDATVGMVKNAQTGEALAGARMRVYEWPPGPGSDGTWAWPLNYRSEDPDVSVVTTHARDGINYGFAEGLGTCEAGGVEARLRPERWYRIRIDRPGYAPGIFYRYHWGYDSECTVRDCQGVERAGRCHSEDFELWPLNQEAYPLLPDLFVDPRDLEDQQWQCAIMPPGSPHSHLIGLRHTVGATNVGAGPLHLRGVEQDGTVYQRVVWSDGRLEEHVVADGAFELNHGHEHIHFQAFVDMYLVHPRPECANPFDRPDDCATSQENRKVSWCLMDNVRVDREISTLYNGEQSYIYPSVCDDYIQGITQGWKDYYDKDLPGQVVILGPPAQVDAMGPRWLEVMIDPQNYLAEATRANNVSRVLIEAPAPTMNLCQSPSVLDCSGPPEEFSTQQRRHCTRYLDFLD